MSFTTSEICFPDPSAANSLQGFGFRISDSTSTFSLANLFCASNGGQSASIHSEIQNEEVIQLLQRSGSDLDSGVWIGLVAEEGEGGTSRFSWKDDTVLDFGSVASAFPWADGQPDNNQGSGGENCVALKQTSNSTFAWNDNECSQRKPILCKFECELTTATPTIQPIKLPTSVPSITPTTISTNLPSSFPTSQPTVSPTNQSSVFETNLPTASPTVTSTDLSFGPTTLPTIYIAQGTPGSESSKGMNGAALTFLILFILGLAVLLVWRVKRSELSEHSKTHLRLTVINLSEDPNSSRMFGARRPSGIIPPFSTFTRMRKKMRHSTSTIHAPLAEPDSKDSTMIFTNETETGEPVQSPLEDIDLQIIMPTASQSIQPKQSLASFYKESKSSSSPRYKFKF